MIITVSFLSIGFGVCMDNIVNQEVERPDASPPKKLRKFPPILGEMGVCFAISYAAYTYYYEGNIFAYGIEEPHIINQTVKLIVFLTLIAVWLVLSIQNGIRGKSGFLACTIIYWMVPLIIGLLISAVPDLSSLSVTEAIPINVMLFFVKIITQSLSIGLDIINQHIPVSNAFAVCFMTGLVIFIYLLSYLISTAYTKKVANKKKINVQKD